MKRIYSLFRVNSFSQLLYTSNNTLEDENGKVDPAIATRFLQVNGNEIKYERLTDWSYDIYSQIFKEEVIQILKNNE
jgi:hypothetical protein